MEAKNKMKEYSDSCEIINNKPFSSRMEVMQQNHKKEVLRMKFQIKDSQLLEQRMLLKERKKLEEKNRKEKLNQLIQISKPNLNIKRDKFRLTSMTSVVAQRYYENQNDLTTKNQSKSNVFEPSGFSFDSVASRATPSWRRGL